MIECSTSSARSTQLAPRQRRRVPPRARTAPCRAIFGRSVRVKDRGQTPHGARAGSDPGAGIASLGREMRTYDGIAPLIAQIEQDVADTRGWLR